MPAQLQFCVPEHGSLGTGLYLVCCLSTISSIDQEIHGFCQIQSKQASQHRKWQCLV